MTIPALTKTWQYSVNTSTAAVGTVSTTCRAVMFALKQALIGFGTNPWTVISSSSGAGSFGSSDLWASTANIIGAAAATNHSWIRLRQTGIATNFELCIDMNAVNMSSATIVISPSAGFVTGGTATARPTASDEIVLITTSLWGPLPANTDRAAIIHVMQSTDGNCTRVFFCDLSICTGVWIFDKPAVPVTGWTNPSASYAVVATTEASCCTMAAVLSATAPWRGRGSATMNIFAGVEGIISAPFGTTLSSLNDFDSSIPFFPIGIGSTTASNRGRHGSLFDLYMGLSSPGNTGDTFPNDATRQFALFGDIIHPWNGTVPVIA